MRSTSLISAYKRARILRRVMLGVFCVVFAASVLWALPWVPGGLQSSDYDDGSLQPLLALAAAAWIAAFGAVYLRDVANRYEQTLVTWSSVRDELGDLRRREYFYERVVIECQRTEVTGRPFTVFTTRFDTGDTRDEGAATEAAIAALSALVRESDRLAALGPAEVGVLGAGVGLDEAPRVAQRLRTTLATAATNGDESKISVGWAIHGVDGSDAGSLVGVARGRMQKKAFVRPVEGSDEEPGADSAVA